MTISNMNKELSVLNYRIQQLLKSSEYDEYHEFSPDEYLTKRKEDRYGDDIVDLTADEWLLINEFGAILDRLERVSEDISWLEKPVVHEDTIYKNSRGRYGCDYHEYSCGNTIEFLMYDEEHECDVWAISSVEYNDEKGGYYIVRYSDRVKLDGLRVRFRCSY